MIVLFKLGNGNTIKLAVDSLREADVTFRSITYNYGYTSVTRPGTTKTYYISESRVKANDLEDIATNGISKIRIGNSNNFFEQEWTNNPLGKWLAKSKKKILEKLQSNMNRKKSKSSIYDDF